MKDYPFDVEVDEEDKGAKAKGQKDGGEEEVEEPEDGAAEVESGKGVKHGDVGEALSLLSEFNVHLPDDLVKSPEDLVHYLVVALHALQKASGGGEAPGQGAMEEVSPATGGVAMSMNQKEIARLKEELKLMAVEKDVAMEASSRDRLSLVCRDIDKMVDNGLCTRADADDWKKRLTVHKFSLVSKSPHQDVLAVYSEIKQAKKLPKGTFLPASKRARLSATGGGDALEVIHNATAWAAADDGDVEQSRIDQIKKEYWGNVGMS